MRTRIASMLLSTLLLGLLACGGGSHTATQSGPPATPPAVPATSLVYSDPASSGWRLVKDSSSSARRLVLNLVGPTGERSRGVGFNLKAGQAVSFGLFSNGWHANDLGVFQLLNYHRRAEFPADDPEPVFFAAGVKPGNLLTVGIFQKDRLIDAKAVSSPLVQIALELPTGSSLAAGDTVPISITKARMIPEDIGTVTQDGWYNDAEVLAKSKLQDIQIALGTLKAQ